MGALRVNSHAVDLVQKFPATEIFSKHFSGDISAAYVWIFTRLKIHKPPKLYNPHVIYTTASVYNVFIQMACRSRLPKGTFTWGRSAVEFLQNKSRSVFAVNPRQLVQVLTWIYNRFYCGFSTLTSTGDCKICRKSLFANFTLDFAFFQ